MFPPVPPPLAGPGGAERTRLAGASCLNAVQSWTGLAVSGVWVELRQCGGFILRTVTVPFVFILDSHPAFDISVILSSSLPHLKHLINLEITSVLVVLVGLMQRFSFSTPN